MACRYGNPVPAGCVIPRITFPEKKPKAFLRRGFLRKLKKEATKFVWKRNGLTRKKPLKKIARKRRREMAEYFALTTEFLLRPENALCVICQVRREHGENILINPATEVHHHRGRHGRLLCWVPGFRASCRRCRDFPHDNKKQAREWGLLAPAVLYDVFPGDGRD